MLVYYIGFALIEMSLKQLNTKSPLVLFTIWIENLAIYQITQGMQNISFIPLLFTQVSLSRLLKA